MGWFILSAVAGLISYLGIRLVQGQLSRSLVVAKFPKTGAFFRSIGPGFLLLLGLALVGLLFVSVWQVPDFPYDATMLNRILVAAEGETTQFTVGIIFGLLAGFTIENLRELILPPAGAAGSGGGIPGAKAAQARHLWLGGSLMLLIFLGILAPHIEGLLANLTRVKTALFEFEVKSNVAAQRVQFREKRFDLGFGSLTTAAAVSRIIERDIAYLENVVLRLVQVEIDEGSKSGTESVDYLNLHMSTLQEHKNQILERIGTSYWAGKSIERFLGPVLKCGAIAVTESADSEIVRNSLRPPFSNLKLIMEAPSSHSIPDDLARRFVASLKRARTEVAKIVRDPNSCPEYSNFPWLHDDVKDLLEDRKDLVLVYSLVNIFLRNFATAKAGLRKLSVDDIGNYNGNWKLALLLFYESAPAREYIPFLKSMKIRAMREAKELEKATRLCDRVSTCKDSKKYEGLKDMAPRYELVRIFSTNAIVFGIAVDLAEGQRIDDAKWRLALSGARELATEIENEKSVVWKRMNVRDVQDTISFFRIIEESSKKRPDKKFLLTEVDKLIDIENELRDILVSAGPTEESQIRVELDTVRNHIELGRAILNQ